RPPRRPRRRLFLSGPEEGGVFTEPSTACWISLVTATDDSRASGFCSNGKSGSGVGSGDGVKANSTFGRAPASSGISPGAPPRRTAASCALTFQSERRNLSAAAAYHFAASAFCPEVSKNLASSNATIASRVFWYRFESGPAGSLLVRARLRRAVICFQSVIFGLHCNSGTPHRLANSFRARRARLFLFKKCFPIDGTKFTQYSSGGPLGGV